MDGKEIRKYTLIALFLALIYVSYLIVKPFVSALLASFVLAYIFHPLYIKLYEKIKNQYVASLIVCIIVIVLIVVPVLVTASLVIREAGSVYNSNAIDSVNKYVESLGNKELAGLVGGSISKGLVYVANLAGEFIFKIPGKIFHFIIAIYAFFYLLIIGQGFVEKVKATIPFREKDRLFRHLGETTYAIVYGIFIVSVAEFVIATIGFRVVGLHAPLLWGLVIGLLALIPFLGPGLVWIPFSAVGLVQGRYGFAIGMVIVGVLLSLIDTFVRAWVIGKKIKLHPVLVVIGVIGGVGIFGFIGVIVGPLMLSFVSVVIEEYFTAGVQE